MNRWISKVLYFYTMVCYAPLEYEEILSHVTARTNLEGIMLHEISLSQKDNTV